MGTPISPQCDGLYLADEDATAVLGELLGRLLPVPSYIAVSGPLGAGKTAFARALAAGLEVTRPEEVRSPTFAILQLHDGPRPFAHVDLYRLAEAEELDYLGLEEVIETRVSYIEWPERAPSLAPSNHLHLELAYVAPDPEAGRLLRLSALGESLELKELVERFYQAALHRGISARQWAPSPFSFADASSSPIDSIDF